MVPLRFGIQHWLAAHSQIHNGRHGSAIPPTWATGAFLALSNVDQAVVKKWQVSQGENIYQEIMFYVFSEIREMNMTKPLTEYQRTLLTTSPPIYIELCEICDHFGDAFSKSLITDLHSISLHEVDQPLESYRLAYNNNPTESTLATPQASVPQSVSHTEVPREGYHDWNEAFCRDGRRVPDHRTR